MCRWCDADAVVKGMCQKHYKATLNNGCCECGRPWTGKKGQQLLNPCLCGQPPPEKNERRSRRSEGRGSQERAERRLVRLHGSRVAKKIRRLSELAVKLEDLIKKIDAAFDAAKIELGQEMR